MTQTKELHQKISDLIIKIEGHYPFAIFEQREYSRPDDNIKYGKISFDMFGDKWSFYLFEGDSKFTLQHTDPDGYVGSGCLDEDSLIKYIWERYFKI